MARHAAVHKEKAEQCRPDTVAKVKRLLHVAHVNAQLFWHFEYDIFLAANQLNGRFTTEFAQALDHLLYQNIGRR